MEGVEGIQTVLRVNLVLCHSNGRNKGTANLSQQAFESAPGFLNSCLRVRPAAAGKDHMYY